MKLRACLFALVMFAGCGKKDEKKADPTPTPTGEMAKTPADAAAATAPADAAPTDAEKVAARIKENEAAAAEEKTRWTADLETKAMALHDTKWKDLDEAMTAILASPHRKPGNNERDAFRHPAEALKFFGITPTSTVIEVGAGGGWWTELLAPLLAAQGGYIVAGFDANGPMDKMQTAYGKSLDLFLAKSKLFDKTTRANIGPTPYKLGEDGKATHAIAMREMHNWVRRGEVDVHLKAIHDALAEGGTFGVEQHRAKPGTKGEDTAESGYLAEDWVIAKVEAAGFKLAEKSEINANAKDTKDYPEGVWTLPPNYAEGDATKAKYDAIGESDRMTLKFTKVAAPAAGSGSAASADGSAAAGSGSAAK